MALIDLPGYHETTALQDGEFRKLPAGGYVCIVMKAFAQNSLSGTPQLVLEVDIAEGEFARCFKNAKYSPRHYQTLYNKEGKVSPYFKGLLENFEKSNDGMKIEPPLNTDTLIGKKIGIVFRDEEREYNGKIYTDAKPSSSTTVEKIRNGDFKIPPIKKLEKPDTQTNDSEQIGEPVNLNDETTPF